ncbi:Leucine-Rich Repeat-Containing Protein 7 [Manis pentadactyla]|nr:Leucine-Rich Repeat-Containing Protein 7 [Manis pentadactyla]
MLYLQLRGTRDGARTACLRGGWFPARYLRPSDGPPGEKTFIKSRPALMSGAEHCGTVPTGATRQRKVAMCTA